MVESKLENTEKSGLNMKANPADAPGRVTDLMITMVNMINRAGIIILENFSIPFSTPSTTIPAVSPMNKANQNIGSHVSLIKAEKYSAPSAP